MKNILKTKDILNKNQCTSICKKLYLVLDVYQYLINHNNKDLEYGLIFYELFLTMEKIGMLVHHTTLR